MKCKIIISETKEKSKLCYLTAKGKEFNDLRFLEKEAPIILDSQNFHLFILSEEKLKDDDVFYSSMLGIHTYKECEESNNLFSQYWISKYKKVIASTDKIRIGSFMRSVEVETEKETVLVDMNDYIPSIPDSFLEYYVSEYNKGNIITEVKVETDTIYSKTVEHSTEGAYQNRKRVPRVDKNNNIVLKF